MTGFFPKIHHAALDGKGGVRLANAMLDVGPEPARHRKLAGFQIADGASDASKLDNQVSMRLVDLGTPITHSVVVFPGLSASDGSTMPLRRYPGSLGYQTSGWAPGFNFGPRAGVLETARTQVRRAFEGSDGIVAWQGRIQKPSTTPIQQKERLQRELQALFFIAASA